MDMNKFKQLHDLVINEDNERARELFHEIVLEKSREIFESLMDDEEGMDEGMGGQAGDLLDEINAEEADEAMYEEDDEDIDFGDEEDVVDLDGMDDDESGSDEEIEDAVIRIEDKLDQLMAEFEEIMGSGAGDEEDFGDEEEDFGGDEEDFGDEEEDFGDEEDEDAVMEAVQLQKVSVTHGDDGAQKRSPTTFNSGQKGMDSKPVKFSGDNEAVPTGPKGASNFYSKGEGNLPGAGKFKNSPGHKSQDLDSAPKPKHGDDGSNTRSPVAESRRSARKSR